MTGPAYAVTRHRRPGRWGGSDRWGGISGWRGMGGRLPRGRLGAALLVLATLVVGGAISAYAPDTEAREQPFVRTGATGEVLDGRTIDATVLGVRGAARISRSGHTHDTGGVWVLVRVRVTAHTEPTLVGYAALLDGRGRTYRPTMRIVQPLVESGRTLQPGLPVTGEVVFEVPRDAATGLRVRLSARLVDQRLDAMIEVPLPVGRPVVDRWLSLREPVQIADAEVAAG